MMDGTSDSEDDAALAAAWGAATGEAPVEATFGGRTLSQAEIDGLLGFDGQGSAAPAQSGLERLIGSGLVSYGRLPMLEVVLDRLARVLSTSLRNFTSDNIEASISSLTSLRFDDYLNAIPVPSMIGVFRADPWENYGLVVVDAPMVFSIVEALLGGRRGAAQPRFEGRPYTTIERDLIQRLIRVVLGDLAASFEPLSPVQFHLERLEVNPRFAAISRPSNAVIVAKLNFDMEGRAGSIDLILPYATLEPVRELLLQQFMGEKFGRDQIWESHLADELLHTDVEIAAVIDQVRLSLADVMALRPGSRIALSVSRGDPVRVFCGHAHLFDAEVGSRRDRVAVRVTAVPLQRRLAAAAAAPESGAPANPPPARS